VNNLAVTAHQNLPDDSTQRIEGGLSVRFLAISFHATGIAGYPRKQTHLGDGSEDWRSEFLSPLSVILKSRINASKAHDINSIRFI
jgi:hypothetical protein